MNIQVMRFKPRKQLQSALLRHIDGRSRPDEARARPGLDPVVRLVHDPDGGRDALRSAKAKKRQGRPGTTEAVEFFFGGPPPYECSEAWSAEDVRDWADATVGFMRRCAGKKSVILSACLHTDERSPHLHVVLIPITDEGYLSWNTVQFGFAADPVVKKKRISRELASSAQDRYYEEVARHFGLRRGEIGSKRRHEPINREVGLVDRILDAPKRWEHRQVAEAAQLRADDAERNLVAEIGRRVEAERALERELLDRPTAVEAVADAEQLRRTAENLTKERDEAQSACAKAVEQAKAAETAADTRVRKAEQKLVEERRDLARDRRRLDDSFAEKQTWMHLADAELRRRLALDSLTPEGVRLRAVEEQKRGDRLRAERDVLQRERDEVVGERDSLTDQVLSMRANVAEVDAVRRDRDLIVSERDRLVSDTREAGRVAGAASRDPDVKRANDRADRAEQDVVEVRKQAEIDVEDARNTAREADREAGRKAGLAARGEEIKAAQKKIGVLQAGLDAVKTELAAAKAEGGVVRGELDAVKLKLEAQKDKYDALWTQVSVSGPGAAATPARRSITAVPGPGQTRDDRVVPSDSGIVPR